MKKILGVLITIIVLGLIVMAMASALKRKNAQSVQVKEERIVPVEVKVVGRSAYTPTLDYTGEVKSGEEVLVYPKVSGKLVDLKIKEGARVNKGQVVALVDRDIPGMAFELSEATSPISGVVGKVFVDEGAEVSPAQGGMGTAIAKVLNLNSVKIVIQVIEADLSKVKQGQKAAVSVESYPGRKFFGTITLVSPTLNNLTRTTNTEITISNTDYSLKPGMFAVVSLVTGSTESLVLIPKHTVLLETGKQKVYIIKNGKAEERWLETGFDSGELTSIRRGISPNDSLVVRGQNELRPGDRVRVVKGEAL